MKTLNDNPSSSNPLPTDKEFYDREFNTDLQAEMFDNGPETEGERLGDRAMKGAAWLAGIVGLFALAVVIAAAFDLSPTPSPAKPYHARTAMQKAYISSPGSAGSDAASNERYSSAQTQFNTRPVILKSITVIGLEPSNPANAAAKVSDTPAKLAAKASAVAPKATTATSMSKADMDRIEKEALEVIHGDYGNNPGRAQKLGADYELVQARVNQLL
ncbi:MAG: hypothetical protein K2H22_01365, partial [Muribaculaceae bacterium]|nr:hypothetical protein [Muribaculaceae bacterium]